VGAKNSAIISLSALGPWPTAFGRMLLAMGHQLSAIGFLSTGS